MKIWRQILRNRIHDISSINFSVKNQYCIQEVSRDKTNILIQACNLLKSISNHTLVTIPYLSIWGTIAALIIWISERKNQNKHWEVVEIINQNISLIPILTFDWYANKACLWRKYNWNHVVECEETSCSQISRRVSSSTL